MQATDTSKTIYFFIALAVVLNFTGLFTPIMAPDAARYAAIAKTMAQSNNYLELFDARMDWLDKPHFPFWITAFFFEVFGVTAWAYKLPGILFMLMGAWYTWLFGRMFYNKTVGLWASLILLTALHIIISNNDVRAEPFLTGLIIAAVYHFFRSYQVDSWWHLLLGALFTACAIMTKGIFALVPIAGAVLVHLSIKKQWNQLFNWRWVVAALLIFIFILPELYALYYQFDLHPEKLVFGETGVSGLRFFFWDSQFGRFFNSGPIKGEGDPLFFVHTTLWAFLPWSLILVAAIIYLFRKKTRQVQEEWFTIGGALLTFVLFSASSFQLPHYINIVFPFLSVITAQYIYKLSSSSVVGRIQTVQNVLFVLLAAVIIAVHLVFQPQADSSFAIIVVLSCFVAIIVFQFSKREQKEKIIYSAVLMATVLGLYLNLVFYPALLKYQSGSVAAAWLNETNEKQLPVASLEPDYALEFYLDQHLHLLFQPHDQPQRPYLLFGKRDKILELRKQNPSVKLLREFDDFSITMLDIQFLNPSTREQALRHTAVALVP